MSNLQLNVVEVLRTVTEIFEAAQSEGIEVPRFINDDFQDKLAISYAPELNAHKINPLFVGYILGNKSRWKLPLCKFVTIRFLKYICESSARTLRGSRTTGRREFKRGFYIRDLIAPNAARIRLLKYSLTDTADGRVRQGPTLVLNDSRTISIKAQVKYPNVSKIREGYSDASIWKWIDLRWERVPGGFARLKKLPNFLRYAGSPRGSIRSLDGRIAKFSYCDLANSVRSLCKQSLDMLNGDAVSDAQSAENADIFDLANLMQDSTIHFSLVATATADTQGDLFTTTGSAVRAEARINPGELAGNVFVVLGPRSAVLQHFAHPESIQVAVPAGAVDVASVELYLASGNSEPLAAVVFATTVFPDEVDSYSAEWYSGVGVVEDVELLDQDTLIEILQ